MIESSLPAVLREHVNRRPEDAAYTFIDYQQDWAGVSESLTWSQLYRRTLNVARELRSSGSTGDRVLISAPQGLDYIAGFLGSLQAGMIAVPLSEPLGGAADERFSAVLRDASPAAILTTSSVAGNIAEHTRLNPGESAPSVVELDLLDLDSEPGPAVEVDSPPSIAHLQYTSGSTRTPAGVMMSHKNIQANYQQLTAALFVEQGGHVPPDTTLVSWIPLFHDMGLVLGIIMPVLGGNHCVFMSPASFLQRPARWIQSLASNGRVFTAAPNVGFELAARKTSDDDLAGLDLGAVHTIVNGSERVQPATLQRFAERFAPFNLQPKTLRPSYGLAEATLYVATGDARRPPDTTFFGSKELTAGHAKRSLPEDGTPLVSYGLSGWPTVRIVDPETCTELPQGTVGEIWVHGDNVSTGYWQKPEETARTFGATLVGPSAGTPEGPWLRTGDLGFLSEGEMFIVGRIKDLLIVYGRNHSPDDIEETIQKITRNRCVAIAVPDEGGTEQLVTIVELKVREESEEAATQKIIGARRAITAAISKSHGLSVADLVLVQPGSIPLTTSGKVRRRDCLQLYLHNEFSRIDEAIRVPELPTVDDTAAGDGADSGLAQRLRTLRQQHHHMLVAEVCSQAATVLGHPSPGHIDPELTFQDLGFDSIKATELLARLNTVTELDLPLTLAFDYPTPDELATHLSQLLGGSASAAARADAQVRVDEPIAVVGMACRFPGGVDSPAALWDLVAGGTDAVGEFPADRGWNLADLFDPDPDAVGKTYSRFGGFLADAAGFDAEFFGISAREAQTMDPQQRLLLEVCWEALETARIDPAALAGSETGVFVGAWSQTYGAGGSDSAEGYGLTGSSTSVASGRVAYALGLQGPAITVDTACSSSLVAAHLASQSLLNGESTLALAGGVTVMTTPAIFTEFARQRGLAADGRCKAFSANADGTGWGEGAAVLVLERLSDAQRNNHPVLAVIAGSAINQDGASNGLTAPNGPSQQRVITQAVANAGIGLDQVDVVEAHGTGTSLGDPIEAGALIATYGAARSGENPLWLGSIKSNIGHTQAAAGAAGIIKIIAALNHDTLPPTLHIEDPSPHIDWSADTVRLLTEPMAWPVTDHPRTAAVSSFGISGTNAHLILQQAPTPEAEPADARAQDGMESGIPLWPLSARTPAALCAQADRLHEHLVSHPDLDLNDVAYSLATTRAHHPYRAVITAPVDAADPRKELLDALDALRAGQPHPQLTRHHFLAHLRGKTVFVFPGQGGQYPGLGRELYEHHRVFAATVDDCDNALHPYTGWSVRDVLLQEPSAPALDRVDVVQPVLFTMMVALAEVLRHYGIAPDAVIGHSQGEIAAAYVAGALTLPEATKIVARRSQALMGLGGTGGMASVLLSADELRPRLRPWGAALSIAAVNGASHTIISGDPAALEEFTAACERDGIHIRSIAVDYASHSAQVEAVRQGLLDELADIAPAPARIPLYSTVGQALSAEPLDTTTMGADYWYRNLREPVQFHDRVVERLTEGEHTFVELSPHPVLAPAITDTLAQATGRTHSAVITTLHRDHPDQDNLATALAQLHNHGHSPSWSALYPQARAVELPTYPFEHHRYWQTPASAGDAGGLGLGGAEHPLLGAVAELADGDQVLVSGRLSPSTQGWLAGHRVRDTVVFPATGFIEVMLRAGELTGCPVIDELVLHTALILSDQVPTDLQILIQPLDEHGRRPFSVHSRPGGQQPGGWTVHASGALSADQPADLAPMPTPGVESVDPDDFYGALAQRGYNYSGLFRSLRGIGTDPARPEAVYAEVALPAGTDISGYDIHPALLDAALHPLASMLDGSGLRLPYAFGGITLYANAATQLYVRLTRTGEDTFELHATDPTGAPVIAISALTVRAVADDIAGPAPMVRVSDSLFELTWPSVSNLPVPPVNPPSWAVCTEAPEQLPAGLSGGAVHADLAAVSPCPDLVIWVLPQAMATAEAEAEALSRAHALTRNVLAQLQGWLGRPDTADARLTVVTREAVSVGAYDGVPDLAHAAAWALLHTAQNENPDRIVLVDTDGTAASQDNLLAVASAAPAGEPQLALRNGVPHIPRLARASALTPPDAPDWQLATTGKGDLTNLTLLPTSLPETLAPGQLRVQVRAAGLNFHDVVVALGAISDEGLGGEAAGVVLEAGPGTSLRPGDAVMGLFPHNAFAPTAIVDEHMVVPVPAGWSFTEAASVPVAFLTAYTALVEIAGLSAGQRVLIHAGTGGVGQAAIQIARHLGAEVFATAHPNKQHVLTGLGVEADHIASSRTLDFADTFRAATDGRGMDVVLDSLRGEFIDASLDLLPRGGHFIEIGKTDIRAADDVAASHPGVAYQAYDLAGATAESLQGAWAALTQMFADGVLTSLPTTSYGLTNARQAFRDMSQARHTGKIVLIPPTALDTEGTVLITGGTGMLGALAAEHLVTHHGIKHLLLLSRRGPDAPGANELQHRLAELGADVVVTACDVSDPADLAAALDSVSHPLTAVIHATGVLDDAVVTDLTPQQLDEVLAAKADPAWHLHRLTAEHDLAAFVLFSSAAGTLGSPGQANYAAANAFLDALARHRHHTQQPATSVAWSYWETPTGMTAHLKATDLTRLTSTGMTPITNEYGLALFDATLNAQEPNLLATPLNTGALTRLARHSSLDPMLSGLVTSRPQAAAASPRTLAATLAAQSPQQRLDTLTAMVTSSTAAVLAHPDPAALDPDRPFKDLGIDSLTALELRNSLNRYTGLTLPATMAFDHPTPAALAHHLTTQLSGAAPASAINAYVQQIQELVTSIPASRLEEAEILELLKKLASNDDRDADHQQNKSRIADMDVDDLIAVALKTRGTS